MDIKINKKMSQKYLNNDNAIVKIYCNDDGSKFVVVVEYFDLENEIDYAYFDSFDRAVKKYISVINEDKVKTN
jgi:threonine synthase